MGQQFTNAEGEQTEIDVAELQEWYKKFVVECPSGTLFMHEFKRFFGVQDNHEAAEYIENMFRAFDKNGVSGEEFLCWFVSAQHLSSCKMQVFWCSSHPQRGAPMGQKGHRLQCCAWAGMASQISTLTKGRTSLLERL